MRYCWILIAVISGCGADAEIGQDAGARPDLASDSASDLASSTIGDLGANLFVWQRESSAGSFAALWGSGTTDLYAVGAGFNVSGYVYHSLGDGQWTSIKTAGSLYAAWGSGPGDVYVGGLGGVLHSTDHGATWTSETLPLVGGSWVIDALWGSGPNDVYAAGFSTDSHGTKTGSSILHSTGAGAWVSQYSDQNGSSFSLWGADATHVYAVNRDSGAIVQSSGNGSWMAHDALGPVRSIRGIGTNRLYVTGANGVLFQSADAKTWMSQPIDGASGELLEDIWGTADDDVFVVGNHGSVFHFDGTSWSSAGTAGTKLLAIWGNGADVFVAGADGIYHRH